MKLVRFSTNEQSPRLGALRGDRIADLEASLAATLTRRGVVRAREIAAALGERFPAPLPGRGGGRPGGTARAWGPQTPRGSRGGGAAAGGAALATSEGLLVAAASARLHAPIADPGKFICIGLNYRDRR